MDTLLKPSQTKTFSALPFAGGYYGLPQLYVSPNEIDQLEKKAAGIKRASQNSEPPLGRKLCATRHGCQGATDCNYSYANYPD